jgi:hypothetical protein
MVISILIDINSFPLNFYVGFRTSGKILSFQTAALRHHTSLDADFIDAPFPATGPADPGVEMFYPKDTFNYFEWNSLSGDSSSTSVGVDVILKKLRKEKYDGLLGFSQGATMATLIARHMQCTGESLVKFVILIGGIPPAESQVLESFSLFVR